MESSNVELSTGISVLDAGADDPVFDNAVNLCDFISDLVVGETVVTTVVFVDVVVSISDSVGTFVDIIASASVSNFVGTFADVVVSVFTAFFITLSIAGFLDIVAPASVDTGVNVANFVEFVKSLATCLFVTVFVSALAITIVALVDVVFTVVVNADAFLKDFAFVVGFVAAVATDAATVLFVLCIIVAVTAAVGVVVDSADVLSTKLLTPVSNIVFATVFIIAGIVSSLVSLFTVADDCALASSNVVVVFAVPDVAVAKVVSSVAGFVSASTPVGAIVENDVHTCDLFPVDPGSSADAISCIFAAIAAVPSDVTFPPTADSTVTFLVIVCLSPVLSGSDSVASVTSVADLSRISVDFRPTQKVLKFLTIVALNKKNTIRKKQVLK